MWLTSQVHLANSATNAPAKPGMEAERSQTASCGGSLCRNGRALAALQRKATATRGRRAAPRERHGVQQSQYHERHRLWRALEHVQRRVMPALPSTIAPPTRGSRLKTHVPARTMLKAHASKHSCPRRRPRGDLSTAGVTPEAHRRLRGSSSHTELGVEGRLHGTHPRRPPSHRARRDRTDLKPTIHPPTSSSRWR